VGVRSYDGLITWGSPSGVFSMLTVTRSTHKGERRRSLFFTMDVARRSTRQADALRTMLPDGDGEMPARPQRSASSVTAAEDVRRSARRPRRTLADDLATLSAGGVVSMAWFPPDRSRYRSPSTVVLELNERGRASLQPVLDLPPYRAEVLDDVVPLNPQFVGVRVESSEGVSEVAVPRLDLGTFLHALDAATE